MDSINCACPYCQETFTYTTKPIAVIIPCGHLVHNQCLKNHMLFQKCQICKSKFSKILTSDQISKMKSIKNILSYKQNLIDIISVTIAHDDEPNYFKLAGNLFPILDTMSSFAFNEIDDKNLDNFLACCNIKIFYTGLNNLVDTNKVFVCNHHSSLDPIIIFRMFKTGFVANASAKKGFVSKFSKMIPNLYVDRQKKNNKTTDKIKKHVSEHGSICIFPEGIISNHNTIFKFRTGAFHTGHPVQPVVIRYSSDISSTTISTLLLRAMEGNMLNVYIDILPLEFGPFDDIKIEDVRTKMATVGNFLMSRVSNNDIKTE